MAIKKSTKEEVKDTATVLLKSAKELKPASLRVKEAAEAVLCVLMEYTVCFKIYTFVQIQIFNLFLLSRIHLDETMMIYKTNQ
jgi:hypothetical protein